MPSVFLKGSIRCNIDFKKLKFNQKQVTIIFLSQKHCVRQKVYSPRRVAMA